MAVLLLLVVAPSISKAQSLDLAARDLDSPARDLDSVDLEVMTAR
uniref:Uncharacterized protein n=1 Tax=Setaria viridis TaxID=4556 RepID=A0A4U6UI88_SETVI|nr:hypothetical protein SEVIR_6G146950v2 [Setaria viridis]